MDAEQDVAQEAAADGGDDGRHHHSEQVRASSDGVGRSYEGGRDDPDDLKEQHERTSAGRSAPGEGTGVRVPLGLAVPKG
ncbi:hypothetical protein GCM10010185_08940 [Saccharothrix coeruleofusca]|uniref:Uncharacterized protein n=1 Tax=Saccharothrix coeruleofusca TaxID=33919 RepID=A0A918EC03_9PSEU|nr:hypothetical protein GCM10010185_08940 [Saccharothrix coeruleofusca]